MKYVEGVERPPAHSLVGGIDAALSEQVLDVAILSPNRK